MRWANLPPMRTFLLTRAQLPMQRPRDSPNFPFSRPCSRIMPFFVRFLKHSCLTFKTLLSKLSFEFFLLQAFA